MDKEYKVGQNIYFYEFKIDSNNKISTKKIIYQILGISKYFIVLNDDLFTHFSYSKTFDSCYDHLNIVKTYTYQLISYYPKELICKIYSPINKNSEIENIMKKSISDFIQNECWFVGSNILDNIKFED
jgi:hypothetical protein